MRNRDILFLQTFGIQTVTALDVDEAHAYKVYKFKRVLNLAFKSLQEKYTDLLKELGIEDVDAMKKKVAAQKKVLSTLSSEEKNTYDEMCDKLARHEKLEKELNEDDTPLEGIRTIPYFAWRQLQKENRSKSFVIGDRPVSNFDVLSGDAEVMLEGVLWDPPVEDDIA